MSSCFSPFITHLIRPKDLSVAKGFINFCKQQHIISRGLIKIGPCKSRRFLLSSSSTSINNSSHNYTKGNSSTNGNVVEGSSISTHEFCPTMRGVIATKPISANENIVICPVTSCFSLASVFRDESFMTNAFGFQLTDSTVHPLETPGVFGDSGSANAVTGSCFTHLLVPDQSTSAEAKEEISFHQRCPVRFRVGNSVVREGQLIMALYMVTKILESFVIEKYQNEINTRAEMNAAANEQILVIINNKKSVFTNYFRFLPNPLENDDGTDFTDFFALMNAGVLNSPAVNDCVFYLLSRFSNFKFSLNTEETSTNNKEKKLLPLIGSENEARQLLAWALCMIFSRSTIIDHSPTIIKAFEGVYFPSTSQPNASSNFFAPSVPNNESSSYNNSNKKGDDFNCLSNSESNSNNKSVPKDLLIPMLVPLLDMCNHTDDPKLENVAVYVPDNPDNHNNSLICLRSLRQIAPGEELCLTYGVNPKELSIFYGIKN